MAPASSNGAVGGEPWAPGGGWWVASGAILLGTLVQATGAGFLVFGGGPLFHPTFGYVVALALLLQLGIVVGSTARRGLAIPATAAFVLSVLAPITALSSAQIGVPIKSLHPLVGVLIVVAQYEVTRRTVRRWRGS